MKKIVSLLTGLLVAFCLVSTPAQASGNPPRPSKADVLLITTKQVAKHAPPQTGVGRLLGTPFWYAGASQNTSAISPAVTSVGANYSGLSSTYLDTTNDAHALVEHAVRKTVNSNVGVVEAGITKDPVVNVDSQPRLFVYYWDKTGAGGGYNTNFTLYAGRTYSPGDVITANRNIKWVFDAPSGNWWLAVDSTWVGYYVNATVWPSFTFTSVGEFLGFGEVAQKNGGTRTFSCSDMGVGLDSANASASSIGSVAYNGSGTNVSMSALAASGANNYTTTLLSARTYRYGGPGTNSIGGNPGNTGSC